MENHVLSLGDIETTKEDQRISANHGKQKPLRHVPKRNQSDDNDPRTDLARKRVNDLAELSLLMKPPGELAVKEISERGNKHQADSEDPVSIVQLKKKIQDGNKKRYAR